MGFTCHCAYNDDNMKNSIRTMSIGNILNTQKPRIRKVELTTCWENFTLCISRQTRKRNHAGKKVHNAVNKKQKNN